MRSPQRFRAGADFRAWRIFSTFYRREEVRIPFPSHLGKTQTIPTHLFPVRGDDANVLGGQFGEALLSLCLKQHDEVVEQSVNLCYVEERRAVGLSLVLAHHPVEDQRETLMQDESEHTNASSFESTSFFFSPNSVASFHHKPFLGDLPSCSRSRAHTGRQTPAAHCHRTARWEFSGWQRVT